MTFAVQCVSFFFFNDTATTEIYTLSLHDALPISQKANTPARRGWNADRAQPFLVIAARDASSISDDRQKSGQVLVRTQKANTPARRGWNADRAQTFLVIATRDASSISDERQKNGQGLVRTQNTYKHARRGWNFGGA